ncbi:hypothetical protein ACVGVM_22430 [Pseudonocardia bannensis]|uniref:Uncharacterized protein n=1 Tax=Pseudonocardia bannensis TaxID=630973 RepID=A0A848DGR7_9PSEU|nr:hypothetical protein [Pseudonocardia bannensis]NMH91711.1 hypothetical protein [Pseudonocardia bannensis]
MGIEDPEPDVLEQRVPAVADAEDDELEELPDGLAEVPIEADPADVAEDLEDVILTVPRDTPLEADPADVAEQRREIPHDDLDQDV